MALNEGKTLKLLSGKGKSPRLCKAYHLSQVVFWKHLWRMRYKCACATSALASFRVSECLFFPQVVYCKENIFFKLLGRLQTRDINGTSPNRFTWRWQFLFLVKKKEQEIFRPRIWACIFRVKWCTVGCIMQWHEVASKPNSSGDVSWEKEIASLLLWICWLEKSGLIFFVFTFVITQGVLLNICLGQRWNAVRKSRLRRTL